MTISIRFSSIHNTYYHYQQNMTPENYKIKVLLRTEGFFRQRKNSRVISKMYSMTGSFNRYETGFFKAYGSRHMHLTLEGKDRQWKITRAPTLFPKLPALWVNLLNLSKDWFCWGVRPDPNRQIYFTTPILCRTRRYRMIWRRIVRQTLTKMV